MAVCPQCGFSNADNATFCTHCGRSLQSPAAAPPLQATGVVVPPIGTTIPNYLVFAILTTVLCCLPTGIPAIIYASQVNTKLQLGLGLVMFVGYGLVATLGVIGSLHRR